MIVRDLESRDLRFLRRMLVAAIFWRPKRRRFPTSIFLLHPSIAIYHRGWGRPGDTGVVAEEDGRRIGCAWYRLFTEAEHGHGYVDAETPELGIAVVDVARGRGVGRALLEALHERARSSGIRRIALSVDPDNPARRLYLSLGYRAVESDDANETMVLDL